MDLKEIRFTSIEATKDAQIAVENKLKDLRNSL